MANPIKALNDNFLYNSLLSTALIQLLPAKERINMHLWVEKLYRLSDSTNADELSIRNDYMWFILLQLQKGKILAPFDKAPSGGKLHNLKDILSPELYEEVILSTDQNLSFLDKLESQSSLNQQQPKQPEIPKATKYHCVPPHRFLDNQPVPIDGIICYMSAFSDYDA